MRHLFVLALAILTVGAPASANSEPAGGKADAEAFCKYERKKGLDCKILPYEKTSGDWQDGLRKAQEACGKGWEPRTVFSGPKLVIHGKSYGTVGKSYRTCTRYKDIKEKPHKLGETRVLTLNVRIDKEKKDTGLPGLHSRRAKIRKVIEAYNPDIIGFQEVQKKNWKKLKGDYPSYHGIFFPRGGPIIHHASEGVAILARKGRFNVLEDHNKQISRKDRAKKFCSKNYKDKSYPNRNVGFVKLYDRLHKRELDVFNSHHNTDATCEKEGMADIVGNYVEKWGGNIILMGDFNMGFSGSGKPDAPYKELLASANEQKLTNAYASKNCKDFANGICKQLKTKKSFGTSQADIPAIRDGRMIDHILTGPSLVIARAGIDRSLFDRMRRVRCTYAKVKPKKRTERRATCRSGQVDMPIKELDPYSDHWAVIADVYFK